MAVTNRLSSGFRINTDISEARAITLAPGTSFAIEANESEVLKIESAGLGGNNGTLTLLDKNGVRLVVLFNAINQGKYGATLPFWISNFNGSIVNESKSHGVIAISKFVLGDSDETLSLTR